MPEPYVARAGYPRLVVRDADAAISFVQNALNGKLIERYAGPDGRVVHSRLSLGDFSISLMEEVPEWGWLSPASLGGSPVLIHLEFEDCDAIAGKMIREEAEIIIPIADRPYGKREGRLRDPFGHLWVLSQEISD